MKQGIGSILILTFLYVFSSAGWTEETHLTILFTNDTHNHVTPFVDTQLKYSVGGISRRHRFFEQIKRENPRTLILDAGDVFQGTPLYNFFKGEPDIKAMSHSGYQAMAMGNHDLDDGIKNLRKQTQYAFFPVLCANVTDNNDLLIFRPFHIFDVYGTRVAVIGFMSEHAWQAVGTKNKEGLNFHDPIKVANELIPHLRPYVDVIVGVHHMGLDYDLEFAKQVKGMDVIAGGHSHTKLDRAQLVKNGASNGIGGTLVHQAYRWGIYVGRVDLYLEDKKIKRYESNLVEINEQWDDPVQKIVGVYENQIAEEMNVVIATATADMTMQDKYNGPFPLGMLISDAIRETQNVDIGIINTGGVRADLPQGPITNGRVFQILPFDNALVNFEMKGQDIQAIVEENARRLGKSKNLQFSGLMYTVRNNNAEDIQIGGKPLERDHWYRVSTADFVFEGNEAISFEKAKDPEYTGILIRDMMLKYLMAKKTVEPPEDKRLIKRK